VRAFLIARLSIGDLEKRDVVRIFVLCAALLLGGGAFARAAQSPIAITDCENITQTGDYILTNDLVLDAGSRGGECLVISSSNVNIDMNGHAITVACFSQPSCPPIAFGPQGGTGIHILSGADHVSITNGIVGDAFGDFVYGIVGEANHASVTDLAIMAVFGITLNSVSHSTFSDISYLVGEPRYHGVNGPVLSLTGGGHNTVERVICGPQGTVGSDIAGGRSGIVLASSDHNLIDQANIRGFGNPGEPGPAGILLTQNSSHNSVTNSTVSEVGPGGIELDQGSLHNLIERNTVVVNTNSTTFAMFDENPDCGSNLWADNSFSNVGHPVLISASPASCIN
jgi:hypothetical protein